MRTMPGFEKKKRGCVYCKDAKINNNGHTSKVECPFNSCPYHVLDNHKTYEEFMASEDGRILVSSFFSTVASAYELASYHKPIWTNGGDDRKSWF